MRGSWSSPIRSPTSCCSERCSASSLSRAGVRGEPGCCSALGLVLFGIADSISAVQIVEGTFEFGEYNYLWTSGALLIAYAAWQPDPAPSRPVPLYGWKAIVLPVTCQLIAAAIQIYVLFYGEVASSERVIALLILGLVVVQLVVSRPPAPGRSTWR